MGILGVLLHSLRDFLHRGRGFLQTRRLFFGALREIGRARGNLRGGIGDLACRRCDRADRLLQLRHRRVEVLFDLLVVVSEVVAEAGGQVAGRELLEAVRKRTDGE